MDNDLISIIVPVYNVEPYICRCLDSVIKQTYKNLEIIIVDDGTPDNSGVICDEYASRDSRIKVIHKKNQGLGMARNTGMDNMNGKYFACLDSDDYIESNHIEHEVINIRMSVSQEILRNFNTGAYNNRQQNYY